MQERAKQVIVGGGEEIRGRVTGGFTGCRGSIPQYSRGSQMYGDGQRVDSGW